MKIENDSLIIDAAMKDDELDGFLASVNQSQIAKIIVENDDIPASIIQAMWCMKDEKKIEVKTDFLKPFFENVAQRSNA